MVIQGDGIKASGKPRSELYIVTKLKGLAPGQTVKETLVESLKKLGTDHVDLFLIHTPIPAATEGKLKEWWKGMEQVKQEGLAKSIGVSNFRVEDLKEIVDGASVIPAVNQVSLPESELWNESRTKLSYFRRLSCIHTSGKQRSLL